MINKTLIFLSLAFIFVFASCSEKPCTDDGCPEFHELEVPTPTEDIRGKLDIEQWLESPKIELVNYQPINLEYGIHKVVEQTHILPEIDTSSNKVFVQSLNNCINYLYQSIEPEHQIPNELIIAQAVIETGWGKSRFANEGNNLFGIRTWNIDEPHLLPIPWTKWPGWGVKVYETRCDSVRDYLRILNEVFAFTEFRAARDSGVDDGLVLAEYLTQYASNQNYVELVKEVIQYNIRGEYDI